MAEQPEPGELYLSWMRDEEGVIAIYATDGAGKKVAVADFWTGPMRQHMGIPTPRAKEIQQQLAVTLVETWNGPAGDYHDGIEEGWKAGAAQEQAIWRQAVTLALGYIPADLEKRLAEVRAGVEGD